MKVKKSKSSENTKEKTLSVTKDLRIKLTRLKPETIRQFSGVDLTKPNNIVNLRLKIKKSGQVLCTKDSGPNIPITVTVRQTHDGNSIGDGYYRIKLGENQPTENQQKIDRPGRNQMKKYSLRSGAVVKNVVSTNDRSKYHLRTTVTEMQPKKITICDRNRKNKCSPRSRAVIENVVPNNDRGEYSLRPRATHDEVLPKKTVSLAVSKIGVAV